MAAPWMVEEFACVLARAGLLWLDKDEAICLSAGESQPGGGVCGHLEGVRRQCRWAARNTQCPFGEGRGKVITRLDKTLRSLGDLPDT